MNRRNRAYISNDIYSVFFGDDVKRLIGFILFWIAVGMAIMLFLPSDFLGVLLIFHVRDVCLRCFYP